MKIKTHKLNSYSGDKTIRLDYIDSHGRTLPVFCIYRERGEYHNDTNGRRFKTIGEAKEYAMLLVVEREWHLLRQDNGR